MANFVVIAAGALLWAVGRWTLDMYRGVSMVARGTGADEMQAVERRLALVDVLLIAALADGAIDPREDGALATLSAGDAELAKELAEGQARWLAKLESLASADARITAMRVALGKLSDDQRSALAELVANTPGPKSFAPAREQPDEGSPYRAGPQRGGDLHAELRAALSASRLASAE